MQISGSAAPFVTQFPNDERAVRVPKPRTGAFERHQRLLAHGSATPSLTWRQGKTGDPVAVPLHSDLWLALETTPRISPVIVTGAKGRPLTPAGFRAVWRPA